MSKHLIRAARARHENTMERANTALLAMAKAGEPVSFVAVARRAGVSTDFLYNTPTLRSRITELRQQASTPSPPRPPVDGVASTTTAVRALSAQLKQQRRRHREEVQALQDALAAAHGENLALRRHLAQYQ